MLTILHTLVPYVINFSRGTGWVKDPQNPLTVVYRFQFLSASLAQRALDIDFRHRRRQTKRVRNFMKYTNENCIHT